jgi:hypothetical protein
MSIGAYIPDAIRNFPYSSFGSGGGSAAFWPEDTAGIFKGHYGGREWLVSEGGDSWNRQYAIYIDLAGAGIPVAHENRPASISAMVCITF